MRELTLPPVLSLALSLAVVAGCGTTVPEAPADPSPVAVDHVVEAPSDPGTPAEVAPPDAPDEAPAAVEEVKEPRVAPAPELLIVNTGPSFSAPMDRGRVELVLTPSDDGAAIPMRVSYALYTTMVRCGACPKDEPSRSGKPSRSNREIVVESGVVERYAAVPRRDVIKECPAGGPCIGSERVPRGTYTVSSTGILSCTGEVTVPLQQTLEIPCTQR
jgi:hypothetical protein